MDKTLNISKDLSKLTKAELITETLYYQGEFLQYIEFDKIVNKELTSLRTQVIALKKENEQLERDKQEANMRRSMACKHSTEWKEGRTPETGHILAAYKKCLSLGYNYTAMTIKNGKIYNDWNECIQPEFWSVITEPKEARQ